jgi:amino acid adenylation domain-containing protein
MQEGLLFHTLRSPGALYHEQGGYELEGPVDGEALRGAWTRVAARHAILRTRFAWRGLDRPLQLVERAPRFEWVEEDWTAAADAEARFAALLAADRALPFDLEQAPPLRFRLVRLSGERHRLLWSFHHALLDGWCVPLVLKDVLEAYGALRRGSEPALGEVRPYREYVAWLARQDAAAAERYWRHRLDGFDTPTPLGLDRRAGASGLGTAPVATLDRTFALEPGTAAALRSAGRRHGLTLNTFVQGAWAALLAAAAGERDVVFGVTVSGRPAELRGVETMVGLFINTLPLRVACPPGERTLDWLKALQERQVEQRQYDYSALADVQRWSGAAPGVPLFESLLAFENYPVDPSVIERAQALRVRGLGIRETTNYPLVLVAAAHGSGLYLRLTGDRARFDEAALARMEALLAGVLKRLAAADGTVGELVRLEVDDEDRVLRAGNATRTPYPRDRTVAELFLEQAAARPASVAVSALGTELTYGELAERAARLAGRLRALGVGPETRVGLCLDRSPDLVVGMLAVLQAGGAYVPLDASYPAARLAFMIEDAAVGAVVTREPLLASLPPLAAPVVCVDRDAAAIAGASPVRPPGGGQADGLGCVIYTSGSTGTPKGAALPQRGIVRMVRDTDYLSIGPDDVVTQTASASFDAATFEIWGALLNGARLRIVAREVTLAPDALAREIVEQRVSVLFLTTALFNQVARERPRAFAGVRAVLFGGEAADADAVRSVLAHGAPGRLLHMYGPAENTTYATWHLVERLEADEWTVPIGRPIANSTCYVLDAQGRPVPPGVPGDLHVGGDGLARGYLGRPDLTAERFVPHPFTDEPGARLYRTGDRVRQRPDGSLEFLGRFDHQVKVRGFRIELGEVEAVLAAHPAVKDAVVVAREDGGERRVVAYAVSADPAAGPEPGGLRAWLKDRLPPWAVPAALPLTANGKLDRRALPAPEQAAADAPMVPPRDALEEALSAAWRDVLKLERVGIHDNFFELGGHSLSLVRLHGRLRDVVAPRELTVVELFEHPTVAALADHLRGKPAELLEVAAERGARLQEGRDRLQQRRGRRGGGGGSSSGAGS